MDTLRYIDGVATLRLDAERCTGCGVCTLVCPHAVFSIAKKGRATIRDLDACMECGACATNCAWGAITLTPGVGCAAAIINGWIHNTEPSCGGPDGCCGPSPAEKPAEPAASPGCCGGDSAGAESVCGCGDSAASSGCGCGDSSGAVSGCGCGEPATARPARRDAPA